MQQGLRRRVRQGWAMAGGGVRSGSLFRGGDDGVCRGSCAALAPSCWPRAALGPAPPVPHPPPEVSPREEIGTRMRLPSTMSSPACHRDWVEPKARFSFV